jgi:hypothetical protein
MRKLSTTVLMLACSAALVGCAGADDVDADGPNPNERPATQQQEFDMTFTKHREMFTEIDMTYINSVGPYAVYEITGENPHLQGPRIDFVWKPDVHAMLCGATGYYPKSAEAPAGAGIFNPAEGIEYININLPETDPGSCLTPDDEFGTPMPPPTETPPTDNPPAQPPTDEPPSELPPWLTPPEETPPVDEPPPGETPPGQIPPSSTPPAGLPLLPPPDGETVPELKSAGIDVEFSAAVGSVVLLRRIAVGVEQVHNNSYVIPNICCNGSSCYLQE